MAAQNTGQGQFNARYDQRLGLAQNPNPCLPPLQSPGFFEFCRFTHGSIPRFDLSAA
jgi:hypothetical protein